MTVDNVDGRRVSVVAAVPEGATFDSESLDLTELLIGHAAVAVRGLDVDATDYAAD
jgi:hypothetical protein